MIVGEEFGFGIPPQGNVALVRDAARNADVFGINTRLPWEGNADVFGLGDGEGGCNCPILNYKNISMVVAGGLIAYWGLKTGNRIADTMTRLAGAGVLAAGVFDIISSYRKKSASAPASTPAPVPQATPADAAKEVYGLGSEWYADTPTNEYLNRFANALRSKCKCVGKSLGECYSCM